MKIERLYVRHFKGVKEIEIFAGEVNEIAGPNGSGKSSVLDAIVAALAGKRAVDPQPLRAGEEKGEVTVDMGDIVVTRRFAEGGKSTLTIKAGEKMGQKDLDALFSDFTFDPLAFARQEPKKQVTILQQLAGEDFCRRRAELDGQIQAAFDERTLVNRELSRMGQLAPVEPAELIDTAEISSQLADTRKYNQDQDRAERAKEMAEARLAAASKRVTDLLAQLEVARAEQKSRIQEVEALPAPQPKVDASALEAQLAEAGRRAEQVAAYQAYQRRLEERKAKQRQSIELDRQLAELREQRDKHDKTISLPIDGLAFTRDGVTIRGLPFEQLCSAEQYLVSTEIGCSYNAPLKIMRIKDGSLLDQESFGNVAAIAKRQGYQLWIESVQPHSDEAIELSEGEIKVEELF